MYVCDEAMKNVAKIKEKSLLCLDRLRLCTQEACLYSRSTIRIFLANNHI
jgi:hypothetical protein